MTCRPLSEQNVHSALQTCFHLFYCRTLVICQNPCCRICIQIFSVNSRSMPVDPFSFFFCSHQFIQHTFIRLNNSREVHKFSKPENSISLNRLFHLRCIDHRTCMLKRSCRYTGWKHILDIKCCPFCCLHHVVQTFDPTHIHNFMRVCNDRSCSMRHQKSPQFFRADVGRFDMNVTVNKSRNCISSLRIHFMNALIFSNSRDLISAQCDVACLDLPGKNIDDLTVFNDCICGNSSCRCVNQLF